MQSRKSHEFAEQWSQEKDQFERLLPDLLQNEDLHGRFVAILRGEVVDSDPDKVVLAHRCRERYPDEAPFISRVEDSVRKIRVSSPRLSR